MSNLKYKIGDIIHIKAMINKVDDEDSSMPYRVDIGSSSFWISIDDILDSVQESNSPKEQHISLITGKVV